MGHTGVYIFQNIANCTLNLYFTAYKLWFSKKTEKQQQQKTFLKITFQYLLAKIPFRPEFSVGQQDPKAKKESHNPKAIDTQEPSSPETISNFPSHWNCPPYKIPLTSAD